MKITAAAIIVFFYGILSGCATVRTTTTAFYIPEYKVEGTIAVLPSDPSIGSSLEYEFYKSKVEDKLSKVGYSVLKNPLEAKYIALLAYGIDTGKTALVSTPIFGQTGGGTTYHSGSVYGSGGFASYSGSSYSMPTYGLVGSATNSVTQYTRAIAIDIVESESLKAQAPKKLYEGRAKSVGVCSAVSGVFSEMLESMFKGFPGKNGKPRTREVTMSGSC